MIKKSKLKKIEDRKQEVKRQKKEKESGLTVQEELANKLKNMRKFVGSDNKKKSNEKSGQNTTPIKSDDLPSLSLDLTSTSNNSDSKSTLVDKLSMMIPPPPELNSSESENEDWD